MPERPSRSLEQGQRPRPYIKMAFYLDPVDGDTGSLVSSELVSLALWLFGSLCIFLRRVSQSAVAEPFPLRLLCSGLSPAATAGEIATPTASTTPCKPT